MNHHKTHKRLYYYASSSALLLLVILLFSFKTTPRKPHKNYVVLVSLDAFRWDYPTIYNTPNLNALAKVGVKADRLISSFPTVTFPNHYTIATGLYPDHHGLVNNTFYANDLKLLYRIGDRKAVENAGFYGGEPVWITAMNQGVKTASFFWVGSEAPISGRHPDYWKKYVSNITYEERIDTVVKWLGYPESRRPELVTLYFDEPDATSHDYGPVSPETGDVVSYLDSLIGVLRSKLSKLDISGKINLIVLSDHGMSEVSSERYINLKKVVPERMITSTWGGNPVYLIQPAEGKTDSVLSLLNKTQGLKAWKKEDMPERWHYGSNPRIPEIVAVADSSWYLGNRLLAGTINGGAHGYDNMNPDMFAVFYATGPAFRKGFKTGELYNVDIYNMLCRILDLKPAKNDGNISRITGLMK